jgi:hypothetical protein
MVVAFRKRPEQQPDPGDGSALYKDLPIADMFVDFESEGGYARALNENRARYLAENFNANAVGTIYVSLRNDGSLAVLDGQHRIYGAIQNGLTTLDAYVYGDLTIEQEADLYRMFGDYLRQKPVDRFLAALRAKDENALAIAAVLAEYDLKVIATTRGHGIHAVDAVQNIVNKYGLSMLRLTLAFLVEAFGNNAVALNGSTLKGASMFLDRFTRHPKFNHKRLMARLSRGGYAQYEQRAKAVKVAERCDSGSACGRAFMAVHDTNIDDANKLGTWLERSYSAETKVVMNERLRRIASPIAIKNQRTAAAERAKAVVCKDCGAAVGEACRTEDGYAHTRRLERARRARRVA